MQNFLFIFYHPCVSIIFAPTSLGNMWQILWHLFSKLWRNIPPFYILSLPCFQHPPPKCRHAEEQPHHKKPGKTIPLNRLPGFPQGQIFRLYTKILSCAALFFRFCHIKAPPNWCKTGVKSLDPAPAVSDFWLNHAVFYSFKCPVRFRPRINPVLMRFS